MKTLRIDEKWSVEFDPDNNDRPVRILRYGEPASSTEKWKSPEHAMYHALLSEYESSERWKANMRDMHSALGAMRNAINEHVPMPSMESDLLEGPEPAVFAEKVATAVCAEIERLRAKLADVKAIESSADYWANRAEAAEKRLASAKEVIAPFAEFGRSHTDERGWIDGFGNERLCNWIGPSDLRAAAEWMEKGDE